MDVIIKDREGGGEGGGKEEIRSGHVMCGGEKEKYCGEQGW